MRLRKPRPSATLRAEETHPKTGAPMSIDSNPLHPIPAPARTRYVGNMFSLRSSAPIQDMVKFAEELGPIYWLDMMGKPIVVVSGADLVHELSDETRFDKTVRGALRRIRAFAGDGLFTAYSSEPNWSKAHNILLPNFSQQAMRGYHPMMVDIAEQLVQKWSRLNSEDEIDVVKDMTSLALDTIGLAGFDYRFNSFYRENNHPFVNAMVRALDATMRTRGIPGEEIFRADREIKLKSDIRYMNKVVDRVITERRQAPPETIKDKRDLLSYMLAGVDRKSGEQLDDLQIRYQTITFLIAGHETTSGLLSFAIYYLLKNPAVMAKAVEEVDRVLGADIGTPPTVQQVGQLDYVARVLKEALRLWPTAPAYAVAPRKEVEIIGGKYEIKKSYQTVILIPALHRDRNVWGESVEVFEPDNHTREAEAARPLHAYKPFGNGQRACIGRQFAMQEATLVLGMILQRFELHDHKRYTLQLKETLSIKPDEFYIKVKERPGRVRGVGRVMDAVASAPSVAATRQAPTHGTPLLVLYGSNLGTAEGVARQMVDAAEAAGFAVTSGPLDAYVDRLPKQGAVILTTASYNGAPPDNAVKFSAWAETLAPGSLAGVKYTVFGCGNRDWAATFQTVPRMLDAKLEAAGATRLAVRGEGDARDDFDGQFQSWFTPLLPHIAKTFSVDLASTGAREHQYTVEIVSAREVSPFVDSLAAAPMTVTVHRELHTKTVAAPSPRSTRHIELKLPAGTTYRAGDHLGVIPRNQLSLVRRVAERFDLAPEARVVLRAASGRKGVLPVDQPIQVFRLLGDYVELQDVASRKHIQTMAAYTRCPHTRPKLEALAGDDDLAQARYRSDVFQKRKSVFDLLVEHRACELPFHVFLEMLPPLRPRYYSIATSPLVAPDTCAITVAVVNEPHRSGVGEFLGVCSNFLRAQRPKDTLYAFVKDTKSAFRLPADPARPVIMVGPGTGLAPFRGFLQERAAQKAQGRSVGPSVLFFGCRRPDQDFLYADELKAFAADGVTTLHVAFSRADGHPKTYVQDLIVRESETLWPLIEQGAAIYVCGDASKMAPAVRRAFADLIAGKSGGSQAEAERRLDAMAAENRYCSDVWASN
jgi:cytochrome P450/NADPH-cytochrome P450 reductase